MKRSPLRRVSKKKRAAYSLYSALRKRFLAINGDCQMCRESRASEIHHKQKRTKHLNNVDTWAALCPACHRHIEDNKSWARENGWLKNIHDC